MPEVHFTIRWPDGAEEICYSPSTAITRHLAAGTRYPLPEFLDRARAGLNEASARVEEKFGFACSSAVDQLARIELRAANFDAAGDVECLTLS